MKIAVDTNIILHGKWLEDLPWKDILGEIPNEILIPNKVLQEFDEKKYDPKHHERAKKRSKSLHNLITQKTKSKINISYKILKINVLQIDFEPGLNPKSSDDWIINEIVKHEKETGKKVTLLTSDLSLSLRSDSFFKTILLDSKYQLKPNDSKDQEIKKLKSEIEKLKNRMPNLHVCFEDKESQKTMSFNYKKKLDTVEKIKKYKDELIEQCPYLNHPNNYHYTDKLSEKLNKLALSLFPPPSKTEFKRYNKERKIYIGQIDTHIKKMKSYDENHHRSFEFKLFVNNIGTCSASSVSVKLHFPSGFKLIDLDCNEIDEIERLPTPPSIPEKPSAFPLLKQNTTSRFLSNVVLNKRIQSEMKNTRPFIKRTNSYDFEYPPINEIVHHRWFSLGRFKIFFDSQEAIKNFHVECEIHCKEFSEPKSQQLNFKIKPPVSV